MHEKIKTKVGGFADLCFQYIGDGGDGMFIFRKEMKNDLREIVHPDYIAEVMNILQNK